MVLPPFGGIMIPLFDFSLGTPDVTVDPLGIGKVGTHGALGVGAMAGVTESALVVDAVALGNRGGCNGDGSSSGRGLGGGRARARHGERAQQ